MSPITMFYYSTASSLVHRSQTSGQTHVVKVVPIPGATQKLEKFIDSVGYKNIEQVRYKYKSQWQTL
jgi:hypothetical protein